jgi:hypothetical protein
MDQQQKTEGESARPARSGINYWRNVHYMDDGVTCYQCLLCKHDWHAAEAPGHTNLDGVYTRSWKFCPFCATQWVGEMQSPRKRALERKIDDHTWKYRKEYQQEKRWTIQYSCFSTKWEWRDSIRLEPYCGYKDAYKRLQYIRAEQSETDEIAKMHFDDFDEKLVERYRAILK